MSFKNISYFLLLFYCSCSTVKKDIQSGFHQSFFYDSSWFKIAIPLYSNDFSLDDSLRSLAERKYVTQTGIKGINNRPEYAILEGGKKYLAKEWYDPGRGNEHIAAFLYYRFDKIRLKQFRFLNAARDSLAADFSASYTVNPMFSIRANPQIITAIFVKRNNQWQMKDHRNFIMRVYRVDDESWWHHLAFMQSDAYYRWFKSEN